MAIKRFLRDAVAWIDWINRTNPQHLTCSISFNKARLNEAKQPLGFVEANIPQCMQSNWFEFVVVAQDAFPELFTGFSFLFLLAKKEHL